MANQSFKVKNNLNLTPVDLTTLTNPEAGDLACDINDSNKIKRYDANAASWVEVGSGGVGGVDILFVQDFESASLSQFTQTGLVLTQVNPLADRVSARLTHQSAINQSFKQVIAVDEKFRGRNITLKLNIKSAASAGNVTLTVRDETNAVNLVSSEQLPVSTDVGGTTGIVTFNIPTTCTSLSYEVIALPQSGSPVTTIDDIIAELSTVSLLETSVEVPVQTEWESYIPASTQGLGVISNVQLEWRQIGETYQIRGKLTTGTVTADQVRIALPNSAVVQSDVITGTFSAGRAIRFAGGSAYEKDLSVLTQPGLNYFGFGVTGDSGTGDPIVLQNGNSVLGNSNTISIDASFKVVGLTATKATSIPLAQTVLVEEADSYLRAAGNAGQVITAGVTNIPFNLVTLNGDAFSWSGSQLTILKTGIYTLDTQLQFTAGAERNARIYLNGVDFAILGESAGSTTHHGSYTGQFTQGDVIAIRAQVNGGTLNNIPLSHYLNVTYNGSLKQLNPNPNSKITIPTSELRMEGASTRGSTATAIVRFDNIAKIRGDAFTVESDATLGTRITMRKRGRLNLSSSTVLPTAGSSLSISKNQTDLTTFPVGSQALGFNTSALGYASNVSVEDFANIGDVYRVAAGSTPTSDARNSFTLSFQEQDISVSVTNTLPQFSESDSSVRVDTLNGYGSTGTRTRRFSNVRDNIGNDIEYRPSAVDGDSFVVKSSGIYDITYTDNMASPSEAVGITRNSSSTSTPPLSLPTAEVLNVVLNYINNYSVTVSWSGYLNAGDVIRGQTEGGAAVTANRGRFSISKVGKPNVTGVDVTPFVNIPRDERKSFAASLTNAMTVSNIIRGNLDGLMTVSTVGGRLRFTALKRVTVSGYGDYTPNVTSGGAQCEWFINGTQCARTLVIVTGVNAAHGTSASVNTQLEAGEFVEFIGQLYVGGTFITSYVSLTATAASDSIITANESFSTDTANLVYAPSSLYTLATLNTAPVGTFITFTYAANTNTRTQTTTAPTQTTADMNVNGVRLFARNFAASSTAAQPSTIAIQIGKGLKGITKSLYQQAGKASGSEVMMDLSQPTTTTEFGAIRTYNEITGVLTIDVGGVVNGGGNKFVGLRQDGNAQSDGYLVINASKSPVLTSVPLLQVRSATIKDIQANNVAPAAYTVGVYGAARLNTLDDPTGIVTSLASNQFTLPAGQYFIETFIPHVSITVNTVNVKTKLRNVTDSVDVLIGSSIANDTVTGGASTSDSPIIGSFTISTPKTFEIQGRSTAASNYGRVINFGDNEVYTQVKITRIR